MEAVTEKAARNLGVHSVKALPQAKFPDADVAIWGLPNRQVKHNIDVLLVNPPSPDGAIWIRSQHRVGRRSRENMVWPQVSLAQLAAMLQPDYTVHIIDAIALRMTWAQFEGELRKHLPRYYVTQVSAPTLTNDMYGVFLARSLGATTLAFGTHVTPMPRETMRSYPALDYVLRGEPELTLRELVDTLETAEADGDGTPHSNGHASRWRYTDGQLLDAEGKPAQLLQQLLPVFSATDSAWQPAWSIPAAGREAQAQRLVGIKGLTWRWGNDVVVNQDRPFIKNLDDLPMPLHHLLPLAKYTVPMMKGPFTFIVTSRGCTAGCTFCIKHVSYQFGIRLRSPENIVAELWQLKKLGINNIHMYADLFTVNRDQVVGLCNLIIEEGLKIRWMCNSRVDYVDEEMLQLMAKAGCWMISWGIESSDETILKNARKGYKVEQARKALTWSRQSGIMNWAYFIIGLPGETPETIQKTIAYAKSLPIDLALFHIAAPYPGTPFFFQVLENGWFRPGTRWEEVDMDESTVLDYPQLRAEQLEYWQKRAFREWVFRPGPIKTYLRMLAQPATLRSAIDSGVQHLVWLLGKRQR